MSERWVLRRSLAAATIVLFGPVAMPDTASADDSGLVLDVGEDGSLFGDDALAPGSVVSGSLTLRADRSGVVFIRATDLRSDDNGCTEPEADAGDSSCGENGGELLDEVDITVRRAGEVLWEGSVTDLEVRGLPDIALEAAEPQVLDWEAAIRLTAGNTAQTDTVAFSLVAAFDGPEVGGIVIRRAGGIGELPATGGVAGGLLRAAAALIVVGTAVAWCARVTAPAARRAHALRRHG